MRFYSSLLLVLLILVNAQRGAASDPAEGTSALSGEVFSDRSFELHDRLEILNVLHAYSHAADGFHTELFGKAFTEDAIFSVVAYGVDSAPPPPQALGRGRAGIVAALSERHKAFQKAGTQRRHFLTNPIVWNQTDSSAEVSVYLQLRSSTQGAASKLIATGRYQGRLKKTSAGWRISEWTLFADQAID